MTSFNKQFSERFRMAAIEEVRAGEELFMADMATFLTPESIQRGVYIDFGTSRGRFEQAVETLKLDALVQNNWLQVVASNVHYSRGQSQVNTKRTQDIVHELGVAETLDFLQSKLWETGETLSKSKYITTRIEPQLTSEIILGNTTEPDERGDYDIVADAPVIMTRAITRYSPEFADEYDFIDDSLPYMFDKLKAKGGYSSQELEKFAKKAVYNGLELAMPKARFILGVTGSHTVEGEILMRQLNPTFDHSYILHNDRLVPKKFEDDDDEDSDT